MKLIEKKEAVKAVPELIWGNKYVTTSSDTYCMDIEKGTEVLLKKTEIDDDGQVHIESKDTYDYIKPEYLQPVAVNAESKVAPKLVVGQKYRITCDPSAGSFPKGTVVTFRSTELDSDGDIKIYSENDVDWIEPQYLTPVTAETSAETTYTVELTEAEVNMLYVLLWGHNDREIEEIMGRSGRVRGKEIADNMELYEGFAAILDNKGGK